MPIYEYQCETCDHCFELLVFSGKDEPDQCPRCNSQPVKRLLSVSCRLGGSDQDNCSTRSSGGFS